MPIASTGLQARWSGREFAVPVRLPEKPPRGQHYERWFYADGHGDEKNALYRENAGDTGDAAQCWHSRLPVAWHNTTWTADRAIDNLTDAEREKLLALLAEDLKKSGE